MSKQDSLGKRSAKTAIVNKKYETKVVSLFNFEKKKLKDNVNKM